MKRGRCFCVILLIAGLLGFGWPFMMDASAANPNPCSEDAARFCTSVQPGPAGMISLMECLEAHEKELSPACRDFEAGMMGGARVERSEVVREKREFRQNCMNDMARFCADAKPTQGGMTRCLKEHENELSAPCSQSFRSMK